MKKTVRIFLLLMMVSVLMTGAVWAEEEDSDNQWDYEKYLEECREYCGMEDGALVLREGVATVGYYDGEWANGTWTDEKDPAVEAVFNDYPGFSFSGDSMEEELPDAEGRYFTTVKWPSTIRMIGAQAFHAMSFGTMTLPSCLERIDQDAFIYCGFTTLRIECELPFNEIRRSMYDCSVIAYDVPEDNALYKAVDGVLYSKDGKTLIAYPDARDDEHFDVPAGVECIGRCAFENEKLKTISLPIGLKTIEDYAFADCTRLQAIAVPLTVTAVGRGILYNCISLERVSLPEGLEADKDNDCTYYTDDRIYRGDNGNTYIGKTDKKESESQNIEAGFCWIKDGKEIPVFESHEGNKVISVLSGGTPVTAADAFLDRTFVKDPLTGKEIGWIDTKKLDIFVQNELFYMIIKPTDEMLAEYNESIYDWEWNGQEGPWARFYDVKIIVPLEEVKLYRYQKTGCGNDGMGIITDKDILKRLALLDAPDGEEITAVHVGTQVRVLETQDEWTRVSTGYDEGWIRKEQVRIVPEISDGEEI